jgi:hypothetical protein
MHTVSKRRLRLITQVTDALAEHVARVAKPAAKALPGS